MGRYGFYILLALAGFWIILVENITWQSLAVGLLIGAFCTYLADMFLPPLEEAKKIKFSKLIFYPFYIIGQVYIAGFHIIKFVIVGAKFDFVNVKTNLKSETLKVLLMDSITFVPGSISVEMEEDTIMTLCIYDKRLDVNNPKDKKVIDKWIKADLEERLSVAEADDTKKEDV
ncbi:MAG: Na+/H+ antiporter subunit E [Defluviitaleaceae bacterium]|nr:Na+/H+ antiporter subunit E [Defluviitaleaceae bacterium]